VVAAHWTDLVDPTRDEIEQALATPLPHDVLDDFAARRVDDQATLPRLGTRGNCVLAVLWTPIASPREQRADYVEMDVVATPDAVVTIRKTGPGGVLAPVAGVAARADGEGSAGELLQAAIDDSADAFLGLVDGLYDWIEALEDDVERLSGSDLRQRMATLRNELLHARRVSSATRAIARRIVDRHIDVGRSDVLSQGIEVRFVDTHDTLVRVSEELDVARELLGGVRDYYQARLTEHQNEVAKTLTVIASLLLGPGLIVGFYGQNFSGAFDDWFWSIGVSLGLIAATTVAQLAIFRWRGWL
jgi:magnesium transporter